MTRRAPQMEKRQPRRKWRKTVYLWRTFIRQLTQATVLDVSPRCAVKSYLRNWIYSMDFATWKVFQIRRTVCVGAKRGDVKRPTQIEWKPCLSIWSHCRDWESGEEDPGRLNNWEQNVLKVIMADPKMYKIGIKKAQSSKVRRMTVDEL